MTKENENRQRALDPFENAYYVQYDLQGGEGIVEQLVYVLPGSYFIVHDAPTKENCIFTGWQDQNGRTYEEGEVVFIEENLYITASWYEIPPTYKLFFDLNGGSGDFPPIKEPYLGSTTIPENTPTKEGYYFMYWMSSDGTTYYPGQMYGFLEDNVTLTAFYNRISSITFDLNGGEGDFPVYSEMETIFIYLPESVPTKRGYRFVNWVNSDGEVYEAGGLYIMKSTDDTLTAVWEEVPAYTITFDTLGGTPEIPAITAYQYETVTLPDANIVKEGFYMTSWQEEGTDNYYGPGEPIVVERNLNLQAYWHPNPYIVTYNYDGGGGYYSEDYVYPDFTTDLTLPTPTKDGSNFLYWRDANNNTYTAGQVISVTNDMTLTAVWERIANVVFYNLDGCEGEITNDVVEFGYSTNVTSVIPTKYGFAFVHWIDENSNVYQPNDLITPTGDITLTAVWQEKEKFTVTYDLDSGEGDFSTATVYANEVYTVPSRFPIKEKHSFLYWLDEEDGMCYSPLFTITVQRNITLKAFFKEEFSLNFDLNGGEGDFSAFWLSENIMIYLPAEIPTKEGYDFIHWINSEGETYNPEDVYVMKAKDDTLTAVWKEKVITVTYDLDGGEGFFPSQERYFTETKTVYDYEPTKEGYEFIYWKGSDNKYYDPSDIYEGEESVTLKAVWRRVYTITYLDRDGNVFATQQKRPSETIRLYKETPTHISGHSFAYWMIKETGEYVAAGRKYNKDLDATLIPCYDIFYNIVFYDSDKGTVFDTLSIIGGTRYIPSTVPEKSGYTFLCWNVDGTNTYYLPGETFLLEDDMDFVAVWADNNDACIVYDLGEGEGDFPEQKVDYNVFVTMHSDVPTREGYVFDCWEVVKTVPENSQLVGLKLSPETVLTNEYSFVVRPIWLKAWVRIKNIPSGNTINLLETPSVQLEAEYFPTENDFSVTSSTMSARSVTNPNVIIYKEWISSDESVATVDQSGVVTFKKAGEVTISQIITYVIGPFAKITLVQEKCHIRVTKNVFHFAEDVDISDADVKEKALNKMSQYYEDKAEVRDFVDNNKTCIFAFEGLGDPSLKILDDKDENFPSYRSNISEVHPIWLYNAMMVVTEGKKIKYITRRASTLPDIRTTKDDLADKYKATTLKEGVYTYQTGNHPLSTSDRYVAMRPTDDPRIAWYRDNENFYCSTSTGTNLHAGHMYFFGGDDKNSAGCQIVHFKDYVSFGKAVGFLKNDNKLTDIAKIEGGLGTTVQGVVGYENSTIKDYSQHITVKYILDREYDNQNPHISNQSTYPNGIFYPINGKCNKDICDYH